MFYNARIKLPKDEFILSELIHQLWLYRKNLDPGTKTEHVVNRINFVTQIQEWADTNNIKGSVEYTIVKYLTEVMPDRVEKGGYRK